MLDPAAFTPFQAAKNGDSGPETLYTSIGRVTTAWEGCDHALAHVYAALVGYPQTVGIMRAYGALANYSLREKLIRAAAESHFHYHSDKPLELETRRVLNLATNASARRTEVAHGVIYQTGEKPGYFLGPPIYSTSKRGLADGARYSLNSDQMAQLADKLKKLRGEITALADALVDQLRSLPKR